MCIFPKVPKSPKPPEPPGREDTLTARNNELSKRANAKGFASTILTGGLGAAPSGQVQTKTLLGG